MRLAHRFANGPDAASNALSMLTAGYVNLTVA